MKPQFLIGAASSASGKTTFTMGLLRALSRRGLKVQPYKCGPDYIDTQFHSLASGCESVNLDSWLSSPEHIDYLYRSYGSGADINVVEGVMGLFDGYDRANGSSAQLASMLRIPVILLVNAKSTAYSVAPLINGFARFSSSVEVAGVVFNQVSSTTHFSHLKKACEDVGVECLGYIPYAKNLNLPSRHLGLVFGARRAMEQQINATADVVEQYVDLDRLLEVCNRPFEPLSIKPVEGTGLRVAVAHDDAFNFIYRENLAQLRRLGELVEFSPLKGDSLPEADLLYLPGGYPELFAKRLQRHNRLMMQIAQYTDDGGRILAECGGMIYLSRSLMTRQGARYPMVGVLPLDCTMMGARLHLGYRSMEVGGAFWRGHEFHYSTMEQPRAIPSAVALRNASGLQVQTPIYRYKNVIAGYTHWYWGERNILDLWNL